MHGEKYITNSIMNTDTYSYTTHFTIMFQDERIFIKLCYFYKLFTKTPSFNILLYKVL